MIIHVVRATGTDGFQLVGEYSDGSQRELSGWFGGQGEAIDAARERYPDAEIRGLGADEGGRDNWQVDDWLHSSAYSDISADTTDDALNTLAAQYAADAQRERVALNGDILDYLRTVRADKQEDA